MSEPTLLTQPKELTEQNEEVHIPDDPDPDPSLSDSSSKKKERDKKKKRSKHKNMNLQNHHRATILIRPMIAITDANDL